MARLPVLNARNERMLLFLEPYGADYWLQPGEECTVESTPPDPDPTFGLEVTEDGLTVYFEGRHADVREANGDVLNVGHQRPADRFPGIPRPPSADPLN